MRTTLRDAGVDEEKMRRLDTILEDVQISKLRLRVANETLCDTTRVVRIYLNCASVCT